MKTGDDGLVRSCEVCLRPRRKDEKAKYQHKKLSTLVVGVQRITVTLPLEEQEENSEQQREAGLGSELQRGQGEEDCRPRGGGGLLRGEAGPEGQLQATPGQEGFSPRRGGGRLRGEESPGSQLQGGTSVEGLHREQPQRSSKATRMEQ